MGIIIYSVHFTTVHLHSAIFMREYSVWLALLTAPFTATSTILVR